MTPGMKVLLRTSRGTRQSGETDEAPAAAAVATRTGGGGELLNNETIFGIEETDGTVYGKYGDRRRRGRRGSASVAGQVY